ncbi:hypothetical protein ACFQ3Z_17920 [Streptomyces nogalater]
MLDAMVKVIHPPVEAAPGPSSEAICPDFKNDSTGTGQVTRRRYVMTIISSERRGNFLGVVERYWKKLGYTITSVRDHKEMPRSSPPHPTVSGSAWNSVTRARPASTWCLPVSPSRR